jgi:hypothetical protein
MVSQYNSTDREWMNVKNVKKSAHEALGKKKKSTRRAL